MLCLSLLLLITVFVNFKLSQTEVSYDTKPVSYASPGEAINLPLKEKKNTKSSLIKNLEVSFDFILEKINEHDNIFQTSDLNNGIRLELEKSSNGLYIILQNDKDPNGTGYFLKQIEPGKQYSFKLSKKFDEPIIIKINDDIINVDYKNNSFKTDKIVAGYGFSPDRKFNGIIQDFTVKCDKIIVPKSHTYLVYTELALLFLLFITALMYKRNGYAGYAALILSSGVLYYTKQFWLVNNVIDFYVFVIILAGVYTLSLALFKKIEPHIVNKNVKITDILYIIVLVWLLLIPASNISKEEISERENRYLATMSRLSLTEKLIMISAKNLKNGSRTDFL